MHRLNVYKELISITNTKITKKRFFYITLVLLYGIVSLVSNPVFGQGPLRFKGEMKGNDRLSKDAYEEIVKENKKATFATTQVLEKLNTLNSILDNENKATREISPSLAAMEPMMEDYINFVESYTKTRNDRKILRELKMIQKYRKKLGFKKYLRFLKRRLDVFERELLNNEANFSPGNPKLAILRIIYMLYQMLYFNMILPEIAY